MGNMPPDEGQKEPRTGSVKRSSPMLPMFTDIPVVHQALCSVPEIQRMSRGLLPGWGVWSLVQTSGGFKLLSSKTGTILSHS